MENNPSLCERCGKEQCLVGYDYHSDECLEMCHGCPIPTESKCRGGLIVCKKNSKKEGVTLLDHLEKNHPELFTKEHEAMFACHAPIPTPEVGEWEEEARETIFARLRQAHGYRTNCSVAYPCGDCHLRAADLFGDFKRILSSQSSAFQKKIGEAADEVYASIKDIECDLGERCVCPRLMKEAARSAADRIKKENL